MSTDIPYADRSALMSAAAARLGGNRFLVVIDGRSPFSRRLYCECSSLPLALNETLKLARYRPAIYQQWRPGGWKMVARNG